MCIRDRNNITFGLHIAIITSSSPSVDTLVFNPQTHLLGVHVHQENRGYFTNIQSFWLGDEFRRPYILSLYQTSNRLPYGYVKFNPK